MSDSVQFFTITITITITMMPKLKCMIGQVWSSLRLAISLLRRQDLLPHLDVSIIAILISIIFIFSINIIFIFVSIARFHNLKCRCSGTQPISTLKRVRPARRQFGCRFNLNSCQVENPPIFYCFCILKFSVAYIQKIYINRKNRENTMFGYFMKTYLSLSDLCRYLFGKSYLLPEKQDVNFGDRKFKKFRCKVCKEDLLHITHNLVEYLILGWWADFHKYLDKNEVWNHLKEHILSTSDRANPAWL